ncbi:MAG: RNA ligase family protein [Halothiobacillaceae bacterium]
MNEAFFRFPHTPHLVWLGKGEPRDDKVLSPAETDELLGGEIVVEEKLDGANLGLSISPDGSLRVQHRGGWLSPPYSGEFRRLGAWLDQHQERLFDALEPHLIVFGEWCAARHSLDYDRLPDWWLVFDVWDRNAQRFWSTTRRNAWAHAAGVPHIARLHQGRFTLPQLQDAVMRSASRYRLGPPEGVILRREDDAWLRARAKLVRPDFVQGIETHWRRQPLRWNRLKASAEQG